ncbi:hypothetical protein LNP74_16335 [Klebsiella pneumoniae subsp. pneumoniae]|nr:hypothetical protein [Klebsiella pneumoniae subsp. pneumoniae]
MGDTGVAVNPEDPRYKDLIGNSWCCRWLTAASRSVGDEHADMEKRHRLREDHPGARL